MNKIEIKGTTYQLPVYLPDATRGVVKSMDSQDLRNVDVKGVVVNTYHLMTSPGIDALNDFGGVKNFMNFHGLVVSDSGGWQVFSLIHRNNKKGKISDEGIYFEVGGGSKELFSPQRSIQTQFEIGSDIIVCLDDFTPPDASKETATETVRRTLKWAEMCKKEFKEQVKKRKMTDKTRPHLYAVVQGGYFKELRKECAEKLIDIGFDGYGYGGYVIDSQGNLDLDLSNFICDVLPKDKVKFALGFGRPIDIVNLRKMGWDIFDCTLPTRDARHKRLYVFNKDPGKEENLFERDTYGHLYINRQKYESDKNPISEFCDCLVCMNYSRSYLRHLFKIGDMSAFRLASIHNLRVYNIVLESLRNNFL